VILRALVVAALFAPRPAAGAADAAAARAKADVCAKCHGADGTSSDPAIPSLAGQKEEYLAMQLVQYREHRRKSAQMAPFAEGLSDADVEELAKYYAAQRPFASRRGGDAAKVAAGKKVAEANHCGSCHLPDLSGQKHVPRLVGQNYAYLLEQMRGFKDQTRADIDGSMSMAAQPLSAREIEEVSEYVASLPAGK
jgi:cytochrome c553